MTYRRYALRGIARLDGFDEGRRHERLGTAPRGPLFESGCGYAAGPRYERMESCGGDHLFEFCDWCGAGDTARIGSGIRGDGSRYGADRHHVGDR